MNKLKNKILILSYIIVGAVIFTSCSKDYITGGKIHDVNQYKNETTYEVLKKLPGLDTLVQLIDAAGIKDKVNAQGITLFALPNSAITGYLNAKTFFLKTNVDANAEFTLDSLLYNLKNNVNGVKDSLTMYLVKTTTTPKSLNSIGTKFPTGLAGDSVIVSFEPTYDDDLGYSDIISSVPHLMYLTQLWGTPYHLSEDSTAADIPAEQGGRTLVKTSFINTKNGVINVLNGGNAIISGDYSDIVIAGNILFYFGNKNRP